MPEKNDEFLHFAKNNILIFYQKRDFFVIMVSQKEEIYEKSEYIKFVHAPTKIFYQDLDIVNLPHQQQLRKSAKRT